MAEQTIAFHQVARKVGLWQLGHALTGLDGAQARQPVRDLLLNDAPPPRISPLSLPDALPPQPYRCQ